MKVLMKNPDVDIMKNKEKTLYWIILFVSLIFSVIAIILSWLNIKKVDVSELNYIGIIVTLLGVIFTIFVGYQIYNVINIRDELKEFSEHKETLEKSVEELKNYQIINEFYVFYTRGLFALSIEKYDDSIILFFKALKSILSTALLSEHLEDLDNLKHNIQYCLKKTAVPLNDNIKVQITPVITEIQNRPQIPNDVRELLRSLKYSDTD